MMIQERRHGSHRFGVIALAVLLVGLLAATPTLAQPESLDKVRGYVDSSPLIEIAGEDAVNVQVSIGGSLLKVLTSFHPDLKELVGGIESIQAVILEVSDEDRADRIGKLLLKKKRELMGRGWQQLAVVRDADGQVTVLVLNDDETIQGLVVMVASNDASEIVFTNVAGVLDLAALSRIGESLEIPGLEDLEKKEP